MTHFRKIILFCLANVAVWSSSYSIYSQSLADIDKYSENEKEKMELEIMSKPMNGFFGIYFSNMVPQNEFMDNIKSTGQGFSLYGGYHFDPAPMALGFQADIIFNGADERTFSDFYYGDPGDEYDYYDEDTLSTQSMIFPVSVFYRMQPEVFNFIAPYLDIYGGMNLFLYSVGYDQDDEYPEPDDHFTVAWNWGLGAGALIKLGDFFQYPDSRTAIYADVRLRYMRGGTASYFTGRIDGLTVVLREYKSNTNMILFHIGFHFRF